MALNILKNRTISFPNGYPIAFPEDKKQDQIDGLVAILEVNDLMNHVKDIEIGLTVMKGIIKLQIRPVEVEGDNIHNLNTSLRGDGWGFEGQGGVTHQLPVVLVFKCRTEMLLNGNNRFEIYETDYNMVDTWTKRVYLNFDYKEFQNIHQAIWCQVARILNPKPNVQEGMSKDSETENIKSEFERLCRTQTPPINPNKIDMDYKKDLIRQAAETIVALMIRTGEITEFKTTKLKKQRLTHLVKKVYESHLLFNNTKKELKPIDDARGKATLITSLSSMFNSENSRLHVAKTSKNNLKKLTHRDTTLEKKKSYIIGYVPIGSATHVYTAKDLKEHHENQYYEHLQGLEEEANRAWNTVEETTAINSLSNVRLHNFKKQIVTNILENNCLKGFADQDNTKRNKKYIPISEIISEKKIKDMIKDVFDNFVKNDS